jgi:hypothetical protein
MIVPRLLTELLKWFTITFGEEILILVTEQLHHQWTRLFSSKNILILGAERTGKTALALFLRRGEPFEVIDGDPRPPSKTALAAIVNEKFSVQQSQWLRLQRDVPGELALRETWAQAIADVRPYGIIYMINGQLKANEIQDAVSEIERSVLCHYQGGLRELISLHIFLNFSDRWATSARHVRTTIRLAEDALFRLVDDQETFEHLRLGVSATQLSPHKKAWPEATRALQRFAVDLS